MPSPDALHGAGRIGELIRSVRRSHGSDVWRVNLRPPQPIADEPLHCATFSDEMQLENSFSVGAPPDKVFAYLIDVNKVVGCVPGAELSEVVDPTTFKGKVKIKVGPITVAYSGTAKIVDRDDDHHRASLEAEGRDTTGSGSASSKALMRVD